MYVKAKEGDTFDPMLQASYNNLTQDIYAIYHKAEPIIENSIKSSWKLEKEEELQACRQLLTQYYLQ